MNKLFVIFNLIIRRNGLKRASYLRKHHIFKEMGENCYFHPYMIPSEPKLVKFHNNVSVATGVSFITHDIIAYMLNNMEKYKQNPLDYRVGTIEVGSNVFIGAYSIILPNVRIGDNVIIGAGSIVAKDIPSGVVVAGNPARVIGDFEKVCRDHEVLTEKLKREKVTNYQTEQEQVSDFFWRLRYKEEKKQG